MDDWFRLWKSVLFTEAVFHQGMWQRIAPWQYTVGMIVSSGVSYWQVTKKMCDFDTWGGDLHQHCNALSDSSVIWKSTFCSTFATWHQRWRVLQKWYMQGCSYHWGHHVWHFICGNMLTWGAVNITYNLKAQKVDVVFGLSVPMFRP